MQRTLIWINADNKEFDNWQKLEGKRLSGSKISGIPHTAQLLNIALTIFERSLNVYNIEETRALITQAQGRYSSIVKENAALQKQIEKNENDIKAAVAMNRDKPEAFQFFAQTLKDIANKEIEELQKN